MAWCGGGGSVRFSLRATQYRCDSSSIPLPEGHCQVNSPPDTMRRWCVARCGSAPVPTRSQLTVRLRAADPNAVTASPAEQPDTQRRPGTPRSRDPIRSPRPAGRRLRAPRPRWESSRFFSGASYSCGEEGTDGCVLPGLTDAGTHGQRRRHGGDPLAPVDLRPAAFVLAVARVARVAIEGSGRRRASASRAA